MEGRERERGREGGRRGEEGGWRHRHRVSRAAPPPPPPAHRHRIPWERAPSAAVCKQSLPLWCHPVFRHWPSPPHGNPSPSLGQGLADVCEKGRLPLPIRILHTMGRNSHQTQGQRAPTGLGHGLRASLMAGAPPGHPWHQLPSHLSPCPCPCRIPPKALSRSEGALDSASLSGPGSRGSGGLRRRGLVWDRGHTMMANDSGSPGWGLGDGQSPVKVSSNVPMERQPRGS